MWRWKDQERVSSPRTDDREMVNGLKPAGEVYIMDYLADPVYTIIHETKFNVRGMVGKKKMEAWYAAEEMKHWELFLLNLFESVNIPQNPKT